MIGVVAERNAVWRPKGSGAQPKDRRGSRRECGVEAERKAVRRRVDRSGSKKPQEWDEGGTKWNGGRKWLAAVASDTKLSR
jgi:hypothetical protein